MAFRTSTIIDDRPVSTGQPGDARRNTQVFQLRRPLPPHPRAYPRHRCAGRARAGISYRYDRIGNMLAQTCDIAHFEKACFRHRTSAT